MSYSKLAASLCASALLHPALLSSQQIDFNRDIRPILSAQCFSCHGPDAANRKTRMRLDLESGARIDLGKGRYPIIPGDPEKSEILRRVASHDPATRMPPAYAGRAPLKDAEIARIRLWIAQGGHWQPFWSFLPSVRPALPPVRETVWVRNPIDRFILNRLEREGLHPAAEADKATLIRRVTLDLTGLPPTPAEVEAFLNDPSPDAYGRVVDRLLASPRYGERMAFRWMEAARYGDTNGYQTDGPRDMWRWRDWVIVAFNRNMPYNQFTIEQLAGDLLPNASLDQRIATGFNRNHRTSGEGGIIPEEYRVEYVADRVQTTATVWMGLTVGCARCHDHKYDPIPQKDFYRLFAYFNQVPDEKGFAWNYGNEDPLVKAPLPDQSRNLTELDRRIAEAERRFEAQRPQLRKAQRRWERSLAQAQKSRQEEEQSGADPLVRARPPGRALAPAQSSDPITNANWTIKEGLVFQSGKDALRVEGGATGGSPADQGGRPTISQERSHHFDGTHYLEADGKVADFDYLQPFTLAAWIQPGAATGAIVSHAEDYFEGMGHGLYLIDGKIRLHIIRRWTDLGIRVETAAPIPLGQWQHVLVTYDGKRKASGVKIYLNGQALETRILFDQNTEPIHHPKTPLRIGAGGGLRFLGSIADVAIYNRALAPEEAAAISVRESVARIAAIPEPQRSRAQSAKLAAYFLETAAPREIRNALGDLKSLRSERQQFYDSIPTVMVMADGASRDTFVLKRGAYDAPGEKVTAGVPEVLAPARAGSTDNRLGLARWLVDRANPLTARVTVNRFWQSYFGFGIVKTVDDFGAQGEFPVHPELLDWLATEFMESGWNVKALQKTIVMSATYRQSSRVSAELLQKDPDNRLLARGPRFRLGPEVIRDQALAVSGLLAEKLGGPSVKPYQPAGLWQELGGGSGYKQDQGEGLYRRSLYTYWKRTVAPPYMTNFDSPNREQCTVFENRTNSPLQALDLMNDVTFLEAARKLAERMMTEGGSSPAERVGYGYRLVLARAVEPKQRQVLLNALDSFAISFRANAGAAHDFLKQGESPVRTGLDEAELAAYAGVASLLLNLDETITKE